MLIISFIKQRVLKRIGTFSWIDYGHNCQALGKKRLSLNRVWTKKGAAEVHKTPNHKLLSIYYNFSIWPWSRKEKVWFDLNKISFLIQFHDKILHNFNELKQEKWFGNSRYEAINFILSPGKILFDISTFIWANICDFQLL